MMWPAYGKLHHRRQLSAFRMPDRRCISAYIHLNLRVESADFMRWCGIRLNEVEFGFIAILQMDRQLVLGGQWIQWCDGITSHHNYIDSLFNVEQLSINYRNGSRQWRRYKWSFCIFNRILYFNMSQSVAFSRLRLSYYISSNYFTWTIWCICLVNLDLSYLYAKT